MEILRIRNQSTGPFLISHITRVLIYYLMYEATQLALSYWLYHEDPGPKELWLYVIMMMYDDSFLSLSLSQSRILFDDISPFFFVDKIFSHRDSTFLSALSYLSLLISCWISSSCFALSLSSCLPFDDIYSTEV